MSDTVYYRPEMVDEARYHAANVEHAWDERALDWPLTPASVVIEVGGYTGRWAFQIATRYNPRLFVFEPQTWAATAASHLLATSARVENYALGDRDDTMTMGAWGTDGCSLTKPGDALVTVREIGQAFRALGIDHIDLMLINIEGYEYTLIPHMLSVGIVPQRLMVQFHDDPDETKRGAIAELLEAFDYRCAWRYPALTAWEVR